MIYLHMHEEGYSNPVGHVLSTCLSEQKNRKISISTVTTLCHEGESTQQTLGSFDGI